MIANRFSTDVPSARQASEPPSVRRSFLDLTHDAVELAELQAKLAKKEAVEGFSDLVLPTVGFVAAAILAVGTVPVLLITIAQALIQFGEFTAFGAYGIATSVGLLLAGVIGVVAWTAFKSRLNMFERSSTELRQNLQWFKTVIGGQNHS